MKISSAVILLFSLSCFSLLLKMLSFVPANLRGGEYEVRVINGFTSNSSLPLVIWCSSKDIDLGGRALQEGDDFGWKTKINFWKRGIDFACTVKWDRRRKRFDAFKVRRDVRRCGDRRKCSWLVREDGFYFSGDEVAWKKVFQWR